MTASTVAFSVPMKLYSSYIDTSVLLIMSVYFLLILFTLFVDGVIFISIEFIVRPLILVTDLGLELILKFENLRQDKPI